MDSCGIQKNTVLSGKPDYSMPNLLTKEDFHINLPKSCPNIHSITLENHLNEKFDKLGNLDLQNLNDYDLKKLSVCDLEKLVKQDVKGEFGSGDDIPSLLLGRAAACEPCSYKLNDVISSSSENERPRSIASTISSIDAHEEEHLEQAGFYSFQECLQPSVLNVKVPGKGIFKISNSKTCMTPIDTRLVVEKHSIVCDEIFGEINSESIRALDKHLNQIEELHDVYEEVKTAINQDCFNFYENVKEFAPLKCNMVFMSNLTEKSKFYSSIVNEELGVEQKVKSISLDKECISSGNLEKCYNSKPNDATNESYFFELAAKKDSIKKQGGKYTKLEEKRNYDFEEYKKFVSRTGSDYLFSIFHLYSKNDENMSKQQGKNMEEQKQKETELKTKENSIQPGYWNALRVFGGLGREHSLNDLSNAKPDIKNDEALSSTLLQHRLKKIWESLKMPYQQRLDMTHKYCSADILIFAEVIEAWEAVAEFIVKREAELIEIQTFEQFASDPSRFFKKGSQGSSAARMNEAKVRAKLNKQIVSLEDKISKHLHYIKQRFQDDVTYEGRNYKLKMKADRVEMLYWLQQERRSKVFTKKDAGADLLTKV